MLSRWISCHKRAELIWMARIQPHKLKSIDLGDLPFYQSYLRCPNERSSLKKAKKIEFFIFMKRKFGKMSLPPERLIYKLWPWWIEQNQHCYFIFIMPNYIYGDANSFQLITHSVIWLQAPRSSGESLWKKLNTCTKRICVSVCGQCLIHYFIVQSRWLPWILEVEISRDGTNITDR